MMAFNFITPVPPFVSKHNFFKDGEIKTLATNIVFQMFGGLLK
jgi:hypothetical protein